MIEKGDIIIVSVLDYTPGLYNGAKDWNANFLRVLRAFRVDDINNNGTIKGHGFKRDLLYLHENSGAIVRVHKAVQ